MNGESDWERGALVRDILNRPTASEAARKLLHPDVTFKAFAEATRKRSADDYKEPLDSTSAYGPEHWALMIQEEAGEVAGAVIGMLGMKKRKNHLTAVDVGKEIADVVAYCACLAVRCGLVDFNKVVSKDAVTFAMFADELRQRASFRQVVSWALMIQVYSGRVADAVLEMDRVTVEAKLGGLLSCCACLAIRCGLDFQEIVRSKFNEVSDRINSPVKI